MSYAAGYGKTNIDIIYSGLPSLPSEGEEIYSSGFALRLGGGIPATTITLARLGVDSRISTYLTDDMFSRFAKENFTAAGAALHLLPTDKAYPYNITSAMLTPTDRTFVSYGEDVPLTDESMQLLFDRLKGAKVVICNEDCPELFKMLRAEGCILVYDKGWNENIGNEYYKQMFKEIDYFTPNRKEALAFCKTDSVDKAIHIMAEHFKNPIIKLDKEGCMLLDEDGKVRIVPNIPEFKHKDSTGAGDAFLAGFCYGLMKDAPLTQSVLYGCITGGKCVTEVGCLSAYVTESELLSLANKYSYFLQ